VFSRRLNEASCSSYLSPDIPSRANVAEASARSHKQPDAKTGGRCFLTDKNRTSQSVKKAMSNRVRRGLIGLPALGY
jgi:hypothetical protein